MNRHYLLVNNNKENKRPLERNDQNITKTDNSDNDNESEESGEDENEEAFSSSSSSNSDLVDQPEDDDNDSEFNEHVHELNKCVQKAKGCGDYLVEGRANELPSIIGLEISEFGHVLFPFMDSQATKLIKICQKVITHDQKKQILSEKNARDSYQLDPSEIRIENPEWNVKLNELVSRVAKGLGCLADCEARLEKLLVYKSGGKLLLKNDTEKDESVFATLVIQLPSRGKGGELVVHENENRSKRVADFGQKEGQSAFSCHFAAYYADLENEFLNVKNGYRLALVYSLCWLNG